MRITLTTEEIVAIVSAHLNREMGISTNPENSQLDVASDNKVLFHVYTDMVTVPLVPKAVPKVTEQVAPKVTESETEVTIKVEPTTVIKEEPAPVPEPEPEVAQTATQAQEEAPVPAQPTKPKKLFGAIKV